MRMLVAIVVLVGFLVYMSFGTLSPCGMLRESVRQHDSMAAVLPDSLVDLALAAQFGALSPGRCLSILLNGKSAPVVAARAPVAPSQPPLQVSRAPQTGEDALKLATKEVETAINECRAKRLSGELRNFTASAQCSNPRIVQAFAAANYRYMDLISFFTAKRLELSQRVDRGELTEEQAELENQKLSAAIVETERHRDGR